MTHEAVYSGLNLNQRPNIALSNLNPQISEPTAKWRTHSTLLDVPEDIQCTCQQVRISRQAMRLSGKNAILMTSNLSGIGSEALIGRRSSYIVLAIVYE